MEKPSTLFTGIFGAFIVSVGAMVLIPHSQIGRLEPQVQWDEGANSPADVYPVKLTTAGHLPGQVTFTEHGCFYCHTQQVRDPQYGPDIERGWGPRRTVARDYIWEDVPLLGSTRLGPDFSNYGSWAVVKDDKGVEKKLPAWRNEPEDDPKKPAVRDAAWIYRHLYEPTALVKNSNCPPYKFLFERHPVGEKPSPRAVKVEGGFEIIPTRDAEKLASYLLRLDRTHELKEAPTIAKPKEAKK